jgi:hypothetical protein
MPRGAALRLALLFALLAGVAGWRVATPTPIMRSTDELKAAARGAANAARRTAASVAAAAHAHVRSALGDATSTAPVHGLTNVTSRLAEVAGRADSTLTVKRNQTSLLRAAAGSSSALRTPGPTTSRGTRSSNVWQARENGRA